MSATFPFVIGCPRSGTTLLRAILDAHPALAVPPESYFLVPALRRADRYASSDGVDRSALLDDVVANLSWRQWALDEAALSAIRDDPTLVTVAAVMRAIYAAYAETQGKTRYADKTPQHSLHVRLLATAFPEARFVHLLRDGRDVVPSLLEMPFFPDRFARAALFWQERVEGGLAARTLVGDDRYHELRYEDLVADPERETRALCAFLDLSFEPAMLEYHERAEQVIAGVYDAGHHLGVLRPPAPTRDWRTGLPPRRVALFEALVGETLDRAGYERSGTVAGLGTRLEVAAERGGVRGVRWVRAAQARMRGRRARRAAAHGGRQGSAGAP